jgi:hypothetical protein
MLEKEVKFQADGQLKVIKFVLFAMTFKFSSDPLKSLISRNDNFGDESGMSDSA